MLSEALSFEQADGFIQIAVGVPGGDVQAYANLVDVPPLVGGLMQQESLRRMDDLKEMLQRIADGTEADD